MSALDTSSLREGDVVHVRGTISSDGGIALRGSDGFADYLPMSLGYDIVHVERRLLNVGDRVRIVNSVDVWRIRAIVDSDAWIQLADGEGRGVGRALADLVRA